ncbi:MAG: ATP-dependent DNA helicase RecG [Candidatus Omnitrophica bacterium]|nr:ATP-dependent DNA helicase RecG [Candidatus Omnitrophota bacterium]
MTDSIGFQRNHTLINSLMVTQAPSSDTSHLRYIRGIGPKRADALAKVGVHTVRDLLYYFPRRYEDRSHLSQISDLIPGQPTTIQGEILAVKFKPIRRMSIVEILIGDESGTLPAVWFNQPYLKNQFVEGEKVIFYGKVDLYQNRLQMSSPEYELIDPEEAAIHTGRITPVYPLTESLFQRSLRSLMKHLLEDEKAKHIHEYFPQPFRQEHDLMELSEAVESMHFPASFELLGRARQRIVFDEFLIFQILLLQKIERTKNKYTSFELKNAEDSLKAFTAKLPFILTRDQIKTTLEIAFDLQKATPMNRLLQGDVGSGKTVVAAFALYLAAKNGYQGAILVPTEILAEQHFRNLSGWLEPLGIRVGLLTSSTPKPRREKLIAEINQGKLSILAGTHALLQEDIQFQKLALLVIDEQHKFGVHQRNQLLGKNPRPHQLVMTATPIPRTLALTLYGDLDVSTIRELPKGRQPIKTYWITRKKQHLILQHIREKIEQGDQAYVIFPIIEESEKMDLLAAKQEYEKLRKGLLAGISIGLVHGKVESLERDRIMKSFQAGEIKVLVATSVIEVGVDNPNATMMVIENAERFGLSQLHQMRGRIGRGKKASECFLFGEPKTEEGSKRLRILTKTQDGFLIAEEDLKLRGPGDFWGTRQSGDPMFHTANPILDAPLLEQAKAAAHKILGEKLLENSKEWTELKAFLSSMAIRY